MRVRNFLCLLPFALAACSPAPTLEAQTPAPLVEQVTVAHRICFTGADGLMARADEAALYDALKQVPPLAVDRVELATDFCCANDKGQAKKRAEQVRSFLVGRGVASNRIHLVQDDAVPKANADIRVWYGRAVPVTCQYWNRDAGLDFDNNTMPGLGCISANNLAQTVTHPADLLPYDPAAAPFDGSFVDTDRNSIITNQYRTNAPVLLNPITTGGQ